MWEGLWADYECTKLNSVITIITHLECVVYFFAFFTFLSSTRLFKSLSPSSESWIHIKRHFFVLISHSYFFCVSNSLFLFLSFVFVFIICLCFFHCSKKTHLKKSNRTKKKEDITLKNLAGGKYIYGPPNFIYMPAKRRQMRYNAFLMSYNIF